MPVSHPAHSTSRNSARSSAGRARSCTSRRRHQLPSMTLVINCLEPRNHGQLLTRRLAGVQNEEQEAQEAPPVRDVVGEQVAGVSGATAGSLMVVIRKPAAVKASVIACSGRCQKLGSAVWPPAVHSAVKLVVAK